jgi:hypothetical protein
VFSDDGEVRPLVLLNGASFEGSNPDLKMLTHTMAFAFGSGSAALLSSSSSSSGAAE